MENPSPVLPPNNCRRLRQGHDSLVSYTKRVSRAELTVADWRHRKLPNDHQKLCTGRTASKAKINGRDMAPTVAEIIKHHDTDSTRAQYVTRQFSPMKLLVTDSNPAWPQTLGPRASKSNAWSAAKVLAVELVESTSVPGLPAKDIIDIDLIVRDPLTRPATFPRSRLLGSSSYFGSLLGTIMLFSPQRTRSQFGRLWSRRRGTRSAPNIPRLATGSSGRQIPVRRDQEDGHVRLQPGAREYGPVQC